MRRSNYLAVAALASATVLATVLPPAQATAAPAATGDPQAVIVVMRDQHPNLKPKLQAQQRIQAVNADQAGIVADLRAHGGSHIQQLDTVSAVAATADPGEIARLRTNPEVAAVVPDRVIPLPSSGSAAVSSRGPAATSPICPSDPGKPLLEPEALSLTKATQAQQTATGKGIKVAIFPEGIDVDNPDYIRPDGSHVIFDYQDFSGDGLNDNSGGAESFGDASSIAAQGTRVFDYSKELPNAGLPARCTFRIRGVAPDSSLAVYKVFGQFGAPESGFVRAIDYAVNVDRVDVLAESIAFDDIPDGSVDPISLADDAAVAAGVTVLAATDDSGVNGTVAVPSSDPNVIGVGATTSYQLEALAKGYPSFVSNNIASLSSGGPTMDDKYLDLVAPGAVGTADCTPDPKLFSQCTSDTQVFGGTSESTPLAAGVAALVIQAYEDSHGGTRPSPQLVKEILTGTATDLDAPADQQGAGLVNAVAAVRAARAAGAGQSADALLPSTTQLDVVGDPNTTQHVAETITNTATSAQTVTETSRQLGAQTFAFNTTEQVTGAALPQAGGPGENPTAAPQFTFPVAAGTQWMDATMIWQGTATSGPLTIEVFDPSGALVLESYDFGSSNFQHVGVENPTPGTWTARIFWGNGRDHFQAPVGTPGTFRGPVSVHITGSRYVDGGVNKVTKVIPAGGSATFDLAVPLSGQAGDAPASVQFDSNRGVHVSVPLARRVVVPGSGTFTANISGDVARNFGQYKDFYLDVPAGKANMTVDLSTPDPETHLTFFLVSPEGQILSGDENSAETSWLSGTGSDTGAVSLTADQPVAGRWQLIVLLPFGLGSSGKEFSEPVTGTVRFDAVSVQATGLPTGGTLSAGVPVTASVHVTNTGAAGEYFFLDPRLNTQTDETLSPVVGQSRIDLPLDTSDTVSPQWLLPPHSTALTETVNATVPVDVDLEYSQFNPNTFAPSGLNPTTVTSLRAGQLAIGAWQTEIASPGPATTVAPSGTGTVTAVAHTAPFDPAATTSTGDFWQEATGGSGGSAVFVPAGGSTTLTMTVRPTAATGSRVSGTVYVDTWNNLAGQGSELTGIPYSYVVG